MLRSEFETLTGIYPSEMLYSVIEEFYNESKLDKHEFCEKYKVQHNMLYFSFISCRIPHTPFSHSTHNHQQFPDWNTCRKLATFSETA